VSPGSVGAERLKEVAAVEGVRSNHLIGYGVVVGLAGTGDGNSAPFSKDAIVDMLEKMGTHVKKAESLNLKNVAGVVVTASLPAFARPGQKLDVTVSSIGTAKSLSGGTLVMTPLKGPDLQVYAVAQGALSLGAFEVSGGSGSSITKNHLTVGRIPSGAIVEREILVDLVRKELVLSLRVPDFTTASRLKTAVNVAIAKEAALLSAAKQAAGKSRKRKKRGKRSAEIEPKFDVIDYARVVDGGMVKVSVPDRFSESVPELIAFLEGLQVESDAPTRVVINERTGTIVLGGDIRLSAVAVAHGGLTVEVKESVSVSQPGAFAEGETKVVTNSEVTATEASGEIHMVGPSASLSEVVAALNTIGVSPRDLVAILQALKSSGALRADLEVQ